MKKQMSEYPTGKINHSPSGCRREASPLYRFGMSSPAGNSFFIFNNLRRRDGQEPEH
jgi:hypothetical protein